MGRCNNCEIKTSFKHADVMWLGLSSKVDMLPFDIKTNSGIVINKIESLLMDVKTYKTNLVKCAPLDQNDKLRYPNKVEINACLKYFNLEVSKVNPKVVLLCGNIVQEAVTKYKDLTFTKLEQSNYDVAFKDNIYYLKLEHPSYLYIYKRKYLDDYINRINTTINDLLKRKH